MNIEQQIIKLIGELKKETNPEKKKNIKQKLKQLYKQLNRVRQNKTDKKLEFKLPIKQDVKDLLSGQYEAINKIRGKLSAMKKGVDLSSMQKEIDTKINSLKSVLSKEQNQEKRNNLQLTLKKEEAKRQTLLILARHLKDIDRNELRQDLEVLDDIDDYDSLMGAVGHLMKAYNLNREQLDKIFVRSGLFEDIGFTLDDAIRDYNQLEHQRDPVFDIQQGEEEEKEE